MILECDPKISREQTTAMENFGDYLIPSYSLLGAYFDANDGSNATVTIKMGVLDKEGNLHFVLTPDDVAPYMILQVEGREKVFDAVKRWRVVKEKYEHAYFENDYMPVVELLEDDAFKKDSIAFLGEDIPEVDDVSMHVGLQSVYLGNVYPVVPYEAVCAHARREL